MAQVHLQGDQCGATPSVQVALSPALRVRLRLPVLQRQQSPSYARNSSSKCNHWQKCTTSNVSRARHWHVEAGTESCHGGNGVTTRIDSPIRGITPTKNLKFTLPS